MYGTDDRLYRPHCLLGLHERVDKQGGWRVNDVEFTPEFSNAPDARRVQEPGSQDAGGASIEWLRKISDVLQAACDEHFAITDLEVRLRTSRRARSSSSCTTRMASHQPAVVVLSKAAGRCAVRFFLGGRGVRTAHLGGRGRGQACRHAVSQTALAELHSPGPAPARLHHDDAAARRSSSNQFTTPTCNTSDTGASVPTRQWTASVPTRQWTASVKNSHLTSMRPASNRSSPASPTRSASSSTSGTAVGTAGSGTSTSTTVTTAPTTTNDDASDDTNASPTPRLAMLAAAVIGVAAAGLL
ncbi:hypothetical protein ON010_g3153 [Phytophthora cinnamomi]|nr:hypothetical protein ON010_g3153 [Phytophthora cinnamomi]